MHVMVGVVCRGFLFHSPSTRMCPEYYELGVSKGASVIGGFDRGTTPYPTGVFQ
eukprot:gene6524-4701_t